MSKSNLPTILTAPELCELFKISPRTLTYQVKRGNIPFLRLGRDLKFDLADVKKALAGRPYTTPGRDTTLANRIAEGKTPYQKAEMAA